MRETGDAPTGLLHIGRRGLVRLVALYTAITIALLAIPALVAQPRAATSHHNEQAVRTEPGRAR